LKLPSRQGILVASIAHLASGEATQPAAVRGRLPAPILHAADWRTMDAPDARHAWDALAQCAAEPNPFYESWYLLPSLRALDLEGSVQLLRFECDGDLAGLLPLRSERRYYRWPIPHLRGWVHDNCFLGAPLVAVGLERAFWRALLDWADQNAGKALFLHLAQIPLAGPLHEALQAVLAEQGRTSALVHHEERAMLASSEPAETYFEAALSGKKRKELRRQYARLSELGEVRFERRRDTEHLARWIEDFLMLEHSGWKGTAGSALASHQATSRMFQEALFGAAGQQRLERLTLTLNDEPIAMLANFLTPPGAFSYKTAFDERFARFSPGVLLQRENLALLGETEIAWCDSCAAADHPMIDHIWRERRAVGKISIAIGGKLRRAVFKRLVTAELGRSPAGVPA
jgi:CelD/BcsL family acetyltransferase involved in cellulose biosynthesis